MEAPPITPLSMTNESDLDSVKATLNDLHYRSEEFSNMLDLLMQIGKGATMKDAEESIMSASCEILKADRSDIFIYNEESNKLRSRTRVGRRSTMLDQGMKSGTSYVDVEVSCDTSNLIGYVYSTGEIVCVPKREKNEDTEWDLSFVTDSGGASKTEVFGFIAAPVISAEDSILGVILVFNKSISQDVFTDYDIFSIEQISRFASNALKTWDSIYEARHAKHRMENLIGMIKHISNETDSHIVIDRMFQMSRTILNAEEITMFELLSCDNAKVRC